MKFDKSLWMKVHLYLSLFFLPAALIYALTGALYIFDVRENADAKIQEFTLPSIPQQGEEQAAILSVLHANNLKVPNDTQIRVQKGNATMGSIAYNVSITTNKDKRSCALPIEACMESWCLCTKQRASFILTLSPLALPSLL